ncbi:NAD(P)/FAD-dependent oxidoreductase [Lentisalinibacter sediminis]|uniref:NAD(P)/FAD-dependent oxidoreductase n=1 Tax=Lentisalinibacter sediminis TaxID=2992237 RepID=UPI003867039B
MTDRIDCIVIGGGVIGLAVGRALARSGRQVLVLESEAEIGAHTSSRNSEVVHAGIYYPAGSLKAETCVTGREALYAYCEERGIPYRRLGKLIVAAREAELDLLDAYAASARANGVTDLRRIEVDEIRELEPAVTAVGGLFSPSTGIVDSHALMLALQADLEAADGTVVPRSRVTHVEAGKGGFTLHLDDDAGFSVTCGELVNAAGLWASEVASRIRGLAPEHVPVTRYAKGHYYVLKGRSPFSHLVYPVAGGGGLGIHVTLDLAGQAKFGPDVSWLDEVDYRFDESRLPAFEEAIRRYWPELPDGRLAPGYTGIRPKLVGPGEKAADFLIQGADAHGVPGLVNLFGIESPGLTAALAIAEVVAAELGRKAISLR